jgi:hypothetical protein
LVIVYWERNKGKKIGNKYFKKITIIILFLHKLSTNKKFFSFHYGLLRRATLPTISWVVIFDKSHFPCKRQLLKKLRETFKG